MHRLHLITLCYHPDKYKFTRKDQKGGFLWILSVANGIGTTSIMSAITSVGRGSKEMSKIRISLKYYSNIIMALITGVKET